EDGHEFPDLQEAAQVLASAFEKPEARTQVLGVLRKSHGILGLLSVYLKIRLAYLFEVQRHLDLATLLGMPRAVVGLGYTYINKGETPEGMEREALRRTMVG
ncbi:MAG TPA: hypothetical protein VNO32_20540, partial [Candidatus Acidoferrum sp.]|nr:hypothetical protein [Candidatus Acidoferrum sp.]